MKKIKILKKDNYLAIINNGTNSTIFKDVFGEINGKKINLTKGGDLSCALFVSSVLKLFDLIDGIHLTVDSTTKDIIKNGSKLITVDKIIPGDIIVWAEKDEHKHIGFYLGKNQAISNDSKLKKIKKHHYTFHKQRSIELIIRPKI